MSKHRFAGGAVQIFGYDLKVRDLVNIRFLGFELIWGRKKEVFKLNNMSVHLDVNYGIQFFTNSS